MSKRKSYGLTEREVRKTLAKARASRNIAPVQETEEGREALDGMTLKERMQWLKELNEKNGKSGEKEKKPKADDIDIEEIADDVLIERPIPLTMASTLFPIKSITGGMIITSDNRYIRIMEVMPINFLLKGALEQEMVTNAFESFLRVAPDKIQIKSLAKKTDISAFLEKMDEDYKREENEKCKEMILDGERFLLELGAADSVTRRYFCMFEVPDAYTKGASVSEIRDRSLTMCHQCASYLQSCGNKVASNYGDTKAVIQMLYDMLNRTKNSSTDFDTHFQTVYDFYERSYGEKSLDLIPIGEFITPYRIDLRGSDFIKLDDTYYGFYYVKGDTLPFRTLSGWVSNLTNMGEGIDVDLYMEKGKRDTQQERIRRNLLWKKHDIGGMSDTSKEFDAISSALSSGYYLKEGLSNGNEFYFTSFLITVTATSLDALKRKMNAIKDFLKSKQIEVGGLKYEQDRAFQSYLPLCNLDRKIYRRTRRNVLTEGLASYYPFTSAEICDENGILIGENEMSGSICHADFFDTAQYKNANIAILGCTGAGKSYLLQTLALRFRKKGIQVFILAPDKGHEFMRSCQAVGGQFIHISPGGRDMVNVMEIRPRDRGASDILDGLLGDESELSLKIQMLHNFFALLIPDITPEEDQMLDDAMIMAYKKYGITHDNESLNDPKNPGHYKKMPILGDVYAEIQKYPGASRITSQMRRFVEGSVSSFNQETNVDMNNLFTVIDVSALSGTLLAAAMFAMLDMAYAKAKEDRTKKKVIFIDEAWQIIGAKSNVAAAEQILDMFKIIRGYGGSAICATQDVNDFFALEDGKYGKGIINACKTKIVLNLEKKEADTVRELLDLSQEEYKKILQFDKGHALLSASGNNVPIHVRASKLENDLITTDRAELEKIAERLQAQRSGI